MSLEITKAWKNRQRREKKEQEKRSLAPVQASQPKTRAIRYDNVKSARAEGSVIAQAMGEPALLDVAAELKPEAFSVPLFAKVYAQMRSRHDEGLSVSPAALEELSPDEAGHLAMILHNQTGPISEQAFRDCVRIIQAEYRKSNVSSEDDIMSMRKKMQERKGYKV